MPSDDRKIIIFRLLQEHAVIADEYASDPVRKDEIFRLKKNIPVHDSLHRLKAVHCFPDFNTEKRKGQSFAIFLHYMVEWGG